MKMRFLFALFFLLSMPALASESPVEITAGTSLEWNRGQRTYTALGGAVAKKDGASISAERLVARYAGEGGTDITTLEALGAVVIDKAPYRAYGDKGVYDVKTGDAVLTGGNLRLETGAERLTAKEALKYDAASSSLAALGGSTAVKDGNTLSSERLTAFFEKDKDGKMAARRITADGAIVITTARGETVTGDRGVYDVPGNQAEMTGKVVIRQGESYLEGTRATVDMRTGISKLFADGNKGTEGRVKGVFYPKKKDAQ